MSSDATSVLSEVHGKARGRRMRAVGAMLTTVGMFGFLASWILPAYEVGVLGRHDVMPGCHAALVAWNGLVHGGTGAEDGYYRVKVVSATCLTNLVMITILFSTSVRTSKWVGPMLLLCAAGNASWLYLLPNDEHVTYLLGYYCWVASFAVTGAGLLIQRHRAT